MLLILLLLLIGFTCGLRALAPLAVVSCAAHSGWIHLAGTPLSFLSSIITVIILVILALAEIVNDKLPKTPSRTAPMGLIARIITGAISGGALGLAGQRSMYFGMILGVIGAVIGTFAGYFTRTRTVKALGVPDIVVALVEDVVTVGLSFFVVYQFRI